MFKKRIKTKYNYYKRILRRFHVCYDDFEDVYECGCCKCCGCDCDYDYGYWNEFDIEYSNFDIDEEIDLEELAEEIGEIVE